MVFWAPYRNGTDPISAPIIALGESWGEHFGRTFSDRQYNLWSTEINSRAGVFNTNSTTSSHRLYLENFDPDRTQNPFRWIPEGIYHDLFDTRIDDAVLVTDNVSNYTNQQFFNALDTDVKTMQQFRQRLLNENGNSQAAAVNTLFTSYNQ